ncbi:MAG: hypothetical protein ACXVP0_00910 [Bacteroidia bacterium]
MLNRTTSILTGCAAGIAVVFLMDMISHSMYPLPAGLDPMKPEDLKKIMELVPAAALGIVALGGFLAGIAGGIVCSLVAKENKFRNSITVGGILTALGLLNAFMIPHPVWFRIACFLVYFAGAFTGNKLAGLKKDA